jgi:hypothetical protein
MTTTARAWPEGLRARTRIDRLLDHVGERVDDPDGRRVGTLVGMLVERQTGVPMWTLVRAHHGAVFAAPIHGLMAGGGRVFLPVPRARVHATPHIDVDRGLGCRAEADLCRYYDVPPTSGARRPAWERRATSSFAFVDPQDSARVRWVPGPREPAPV